MTVYDTWRRCDIAKRTPEENLISDMVMLIEKLGAHYHLTSCVVKLTEAREHLADWIDGVPEKQRTTCEY